jgi:UDP-2,3-diacylglucosamine hydrolase
MNALAKAPAFPKLGIIAGEGDLPRLLIQSCIAQGRPFFVIALEESTDAEILEDVPHSWVRLGAIGKALSALRHEGCVELVMAGRVRRPKLSALRPDLKGTMLLAKLGSNLLTGDDELLSLIVKFLEDEGFKIIGAEQIMSELLTPEGLIGSIYPDKRSQTDIEFGAKIARQIGALDIGQAVIVQNQLVLGIEAAEGTAELIRRCANYRAEEKGGVLIKVKKPQQESRVDLPSIGPATIEALAECGLAGVALEAGASLLIERREIARRADALGIFVIGFSILE